MVKVQRWRRPNSWCTEESTTLFMESLWGSSHSFNIEPIRMEGSFVIITWGYIVPVLSFIGVIFNLLCLLVLLSRDLHWSCYTYLAALSTTDFLLLLLMGVNGIGHGHFSKDIQWAYFEANVYLPVGSIVSSMSSCLTVTVTIERFILLYFPIKARSICTPPLARLTVAIIVAVTTIFNIPRFFMYKVDGPTVTLTDFGKGPFGQFLSWFNMLVFSFGVYTVLLVLNVLLIRRLSTNKQSRVSSDGRLTVPRHNKEDIRLTRMMIAIVTIYILADLPSALVSRTTLGAILGQEGPLLKSEAYENALCVASILTVIQISANFVVYCLLNNKFWWVIKWRICGSVCANQVGQYPSTISHPHTSQGRNIFSVSSYMNQNSR